MSRQDANAAFALTSFLYGGNAAYVGGPACALSGRSDIGRCAVAGFLPEPQGRGCRHRQGGATARPGAGRDWPPPARSDLTAALDGDWREVEKRGRRQGQGARRRPAASSCPPPRCSRRRATRSMR